MCLFGDKIVFLHFQMIFEEMVLFKAYESALERLNEKVKRKNEQRILSRKISGSSQWPQSR